jgi:hypothetical protein
MGALVLWVVVLGLLLAVALQAWRIARLESEREALERRLAALADREREPLLLTQIAPSDPLEPLLLDVPVPVAANDAFETNLWQPIGMAGRLWRRHGVEALVGVAAFAGLATPALAGATPSRVTMFFLCAAAAAAFGVCLWRHFAGAMIASLAGLLVAFASSVIGDAPAQALALLGVGALGAAAAGFRSRSGASAAWTRFAARSPGIGIAASSALALMPWLSASQAPLGAIALPALFGITLIASAAALVRVRLAAASTLAAAVLGLLIGALAYLRARYPLPAGADFYPLAMLSAAAIAAATGLARPHHRSRALVAGFGAAGAALLALMAATTRADWHGPAAWTALALGSGLLGAGAWAISRQVANPAQDRGVDFWLMGSTALAALVVEAALAEAARPLAHGTLAGAYAYAAARLDWRGLGLAAVGVALVALVSALAHADDGWLSLFGATAGAALIWVGSRASNADRGPTTWLTSAAGLIALVVLFSLLAWAVRAADLDGLVHNGLRSLLLMGLGIAIIVRGARNEGAVARWSGETLVTAGLVLALVGSGLVVNPWWGFDPAPVRGAPLLNPLLLGFAAPAALSFAAAARLKQRTRWAEELCRAAGAGLALMWAVLEIRRSFHGEALSQGGIMAVEAAVFALLALGCAVALASLARHKRQLQRVAQPASWVALAMASILILAVGHPWWGPETRGPSYVIAVVLHAAAAATGFLLAERVRASRALCWAALLCALAFCWSAGHAAIHGLIGAGAGAEPLAHAVWPLCLALFLWAMRQRAAREANAAAAILVWIGLVIAAVCLIVIFNPWWGLLPASLAHPAAAAVGLSAYGLAAGLSGFAAEMRQAPTAYWMQRAGYALASAHALTFGILAVRRAFHEGMATAAFAQTEAWAYAAVLGAFGAGSFWFGVRRNSALLRLGGLAALACAIVFFFLLAFTRLSGFALAGALVSAVALLAACAWFASVYRPRLRPQRRAAFGR